MMSDTSVLIVDDEFQACQNVADILRAQGYLVAVAAHGLEALNYLETRRPPDLILLDLEMPFMNGREFRAEQMANPRWATIPVILMSATVTSDIATGMKAKGFLKKPFAIPPLLALVEAHTEPHALVHPEPGH